MTPRLILFALLLACALPADARPASPRLKRVRASDELSTRVIAAGLERSAIVRRLIADIETSKVMVFVAVDHEMPATLAGRTSLLGPAGRYRYVRVSLNRSLLVVDAIATLAHELEHVRELIAHPDVVDGATLAELYRRIGHESELSGRPVVDTDGARQMGHAVRREMATGLEPMPGDPPMARERRRIR